MAPPSPPVGGDTSVRAPEAAAACPTDVSRKQDTSQKVAVELPYGLQTWLFTVPGIAELEMSAEGQAEPWGPPSSFAKRVLVTGGAGFM